MSGPAERRPVPAGFFALRTPLLPYDELETLFGGAGEHLPGENLAELEAALAEDRRRGRSVLARFVARPAIREALFLASPDLIDSLEEWEKDPDGARGRRVERALVKYLVRMSSRPTPFGLFAASCTGLVGEETRFVLASRDAHRRHTRLDVDYLFRLAEAIANDPSARGKLVYRPASSLYRSGDRWRYVEARSGENGRSYGLVAVPDSQALRETLARAKAGVSFTDLAEALVDDEVSLAEATEFVEGLAEAQVLVPDVGLRITGPEPARVMAALLAARLGPSGAADALAGTADALRSLDAAGDAVDPGRYRTLANALPHLPARMDLSRLFQVDAVAEASVTLGGTVLEELERAVKIAWRLLPRSRPEMTAFREALLERYGEREVPLLEALDEESGVGYPPWEGERSATEPLLDGVAFPPPAESGKTRWRERERLLLDRLHEAWSHGETEIVLSDADLAVMAPGEPLPLPGAFAAVAAVAAASDDALARGDFLLALTGLDGPAGACLLGRFCHADPQLHRFVEEHLREEETLDPEAVYAEVVHLPEGRAGNVLLRPVLRDYEIPFLGVSGVPAERQLPLSDLLVSVSGDDVVLRSRRLGRRIVPRTTAAHDYTRNSLGIYRFLGEMQTRDVAVGRPWSWGPLGSAPFLPRVRVGRTVLAPATWNVAAKELAGFRSLGEARRHVAVREWREKRGVPRRVLLVGEDDHELVVDFGAVLSVDAFLHAASGRDAVVLSEILLGSESLCTRGPDGRYVHELVVPFIQRGPAQGPEAPQPGPDVTRDASLVRRSFPPASEWMTAKIYAGVATGDRFLREELGPFVREALEKGAVDRWFFIRYTDPRPHLRLRLHGDPARLNAEVLPALASTLRASPLAELVWRVQLDTYEREVERYGGPDAIETVEEAFQADSEAVLELLGLLEEGDVGSEERWRIALRGADALFDDLGLDLPGRRRLVERVRRELGTEVGADAAFGRSLGARYRTLSKDLEQVLEPEDEEASPLGPGIEVLRSRSRRIAPLGRTLRGLESEGRLSCSLSSIAASLVHMHLNRLLRSAQRRQELVACDFLSRLYASRQARKG